MVTSCCKAPMGQAGTGGLTGGWNEGDVAYYTGASHSLSSGDNLTYGDRGEVVGESLVYDGHDDKRVAIKFDRNDNPVACFVASLRPWPPPEELAGGWKMGETAVYIGSPRNWEGERMMTGDVVRIVGPAPETDNSRSSRSKDSSGEVAVLFPGHSVPVVTRSLARETNVCSGCEGWCRGPASEKLRVMDIDASERAYKPTKRVTSVRDPKSPIM
mmetsp:Transcript_62542/g.183366  ORF Transcript_62542/g.183366 Transcript_62542/m.183366 type:complete len:215 (-) Transcript_62542:29-673(-)